MLMNRKTRTKICSRCKIEYNVSFFGKCLARPDRLTHHCRKCVYELSKTKNARARQKKYRNGDLLRSKRYLLKKHFNITYEDYLVILEKQDSVCILCGKTNENGRMLAVDHNHETGEVRGLLCSKCNIGIGQFNEDISVMLKAIEYLNKSNE